LNRIVGLSVTAILRSSKSAIAAEYGAIGGV
jgi:hypothetical protein